CLRRPQRPTLFPYTTLFRSHFHTNRRKDGLSGFPKRSESEYDTFGVGHSSTSISAALGMAVASVYKGEHDRQHVAVIGDGAMTRSEEHTSELQSRENLVCRL